MAGGGVGREGEEKGEGEGMRLGELLMGVGTVVVAMAVAGVAGRMGWEDLALAGMVGVVLVGVGLVVKGDRK